MNLLFVQLVVNFEELTFMSEYFGFLFTIKGYKFLKISDFDKKY